MNSFVFLPLIAGLFGVIALTSLLWSVRGSRFNADDRKARPIRVRNQASRSSHKQ